MKNINELLTTSPLDENIKATLLNTITNDGNFTDYLFTGFEDTDRRLTAIMLCDELNHNHIVLASDQHTTTDSIHNVINAHVKNAPDDTDRFVVIVTNFDDADGNMWRDIMMTFKGVNFIFIVEDANEVDPTLYNKLVEIVFNTPC